LTGRYQRQNGPISGTVLGLRGWLHAGFTT
jgi:hypothetical protein